MLFLGYSTGMRIRYFRKKAGLTQKELAALNGRDRTYFCGSYFGYGFHEDAVRSAVDVGMLMGIDL